MATLERLDMGRNLAPSGRWTLRDKAAPRRLAWTLSRMRLPNIAQDKWTLRSAEASHAAHPETFRIPPAIQRHNLKRGQAAKLMFEIKSEDEDGTLDIACERMWVIVAERVGDTYIGILDNQPISIAHGEDAYLRFGAEIPFKAEHVIEVDTPPTKYSAWQLGQKPEREWSRE